VALKSLEYRGESICISYELCNLEASKDLLFLHGWGSSKELMKSAFGSTLQEFKHIYIDLSGFGGSKVSQVLTTLDYAHIVKIFLDSIGSRPHMIVGHSFGGKVATLLNPARLILLSSAGIQWKKPLKVRLKIALFKLLKPLGISKFRSWFVASDAAALTPNMYETFKNVVDEDFECEFASFKGRALLCWGGDDTATPLASGKKIDSLMEDSSLVVYKGDHYFFLEHKKAVAEQIERFCGE